MPFCPSCRSEYRAGFTRCADCGASLVGQLAPAAPPQLIGIPIEETQIGTFPTRMEAEMWARFLQLDGIPSVLVPIGAGWGQPGTDQLWPHALRVRLADAETARRLLAR